MAYCPDGPLSREQLDLVDVVGDSYLHRSAAAETAGRRRRILGQRRHGDGPAADTRYGRRLRSSKHPRRVQRQLRQGPPGGRRPRHGRRRRHAARSPRRLPVRPQAPPHHAAEPGRPRKAVDRRGHARPRCRGESAGQNRPDRNVVAFERRSGRQIDRRRPHRRSAICRSNRRRSASE